MILKDNSPDFISSRTKFMDTNKKYLLIIKNIYRGDIVLKIVFSLVFLSTRFRDN